MVRGWVRKFVAIVIGLVCSQALAQVAGPAPDEGTIAPVRPTDPGVYPAPIVPPRTAYQPTINDPVVPPRADLTIPPGAAVATPKVSPPRIFRKSRRYETEFNEESVLLDGVRRYVFTGGVILNFTGFGGDSGPSNPPNGQNNGQPKPADTTNTNTKTNQPGGPNAQPGGPNPPPAGPNPAQNVNGPDDIELEADDVVIWEKGGDLDKRLPPAGAPPQPDTPKTYEVYLSGNVVIRTRPKIGPMQTLRGKQIYYDIDREKAIALSAKFEYRPMLPTPGGGQTLAADPFNFVAQEIRKLDAENYEGLKASFNSSKLPSDPGIQVDAPRMLLTDRVVQLTNVFGLPYREMWTGNPVVGDQKMLTAYDAVPKVEGIPFFYFPFYRGNADEPLGPFQSIGVGENRVFGFQLYTTWNMMEILALKPPPNQTQKWTLELDYLSMRGVGLGSDYHYHIPASDPDSGLFGVDGTLRYYGIRDYGQDDLGGYRGPEPQQPDYRQRFTWTHMQDFTPELFFQGQLAYVSDKNFLEQYYKQDWDLGPNQETFANLTYQHDNYWINGLIEPHMDRPWIAETSWLPKVDGALIGQSFFDRIVYDIKGGAGFAITHPTETNPVSILPTDQRVDTGRLDVMQEVSVPFKLGPVQFAPYGMLDLTGYSQDLAGNPIGRVWGGGGTRASIAASHLYEDVSSDLFNFRDLYHKMVLSANYLYAETNVHYNQLPMLDRLNDDATDQAYRNIRPMESMMVSGPAGLALQNSPVYDPQLYAIRRAMLDKVDTLDDIDVLQLDLRQRLQTKRGYPGEEHEVDLFYLDTSISYFPQASRDDFGHPWAFAEWNALWNIGDRVALNSTGWMEPYNGGSRYWTVGAYLNRPDGTNFYLGYRQTDPLNSRAVSASVSYQLSKRYFVAASASYDFGINQAMSNSLSLTRVGTDLTVSFGITYNSLVNNFGFTFMVVPNLFASTAPGGMPMMGQAMGGGR